MTDKKKTTTIGVKWSQVEHKAESYRNAFVRLFKRYEGAKLLTEDGDPLLIDGKQVKVTQRVFADHFGIPYTTFRNWLRAAGETEATEKQAKASEKRRVPKTDTTSSKMDDTPVEDFTADGGAPFLGLVSNVHRLAQSVRDSLRTEDLTEEDRTNMAGTIDQLVDELTAVRSELEAVTTAA